MTSADSQSSDNWFTIIKLNISSSNCPGNDCCVLTLNLSSFRNKKSQDTKENISLNSTQYLNVRNRAALSIDDILENETEALQFRPKLRSTMVFQCINNG